VQKYSVNLTVDAESAVKFFDEAIETVANLENLPRANAVFKDDPDVRKVQMQNHKVAIVYLVDDDHFEVIAVRAYHQMQNPVQYRHSVSEYNLFK